MLLAALGIADAGVTPPEAPRGVAKGDVIWASLGTSETVGLRVETLAVLHPSPFPRDTCTPWHRPPGQVCGAPQVRCR